MSEHAVGALPPIRAPAEDKEAEAEGAKPLAAAGSAESMTLKKEERSSSSDEEAPKRDQDEDWMELADSIWTGWRRLYEDVGMGECEVGGCCIHPPSDTQDAACSTPRSSKRDAFGHRCRISSWMYNPSHECDVRFHH